MLGGLITLVNGVLPAFPPGVGLSNSLETRFRWISFPGLIRGIITLHFFMFFVLALRPQALELFTYDLQKILAGEAWRLISFILIPPVTPGSPVSYVFIFFILLIGFLMGDSIEHAWGAFRTSLYCYGLFICQILANTLLSWLAGDTVPIVWGGILFYEALFFAFATLFPKHEFRLMLLFPVPVFILAIMNAMAGVMFALLGGPLVAGYLGICFFPYFVWAVPRIVSYLRARSDTRQRQARFQAKALSAKAAFHTCESCGATDQSHPDREFRITAEDAELCSVCLDERSRRSKP